MGDTDYVELPCRRIAVSDQEGDPRTSERKPKQASSALALASAGGICRLKPISLGSKKSGLLKNNTKRSPLPPMLPVPFREKRKPKLRGRAFM